MPKLPGGLKHSFWSLLDTISYPVIYFALTPFLIRYMGAAMYGFWMVLNTLIVVLQLFNFNLGYTAMRHIAQERAAGNNRLVTGIINSLLKITIVQFAGVAILGCVLLVLLSYTGWLGDYAFGFRYGAWCVLLATLLGGLKYFEQVFQNIIKSYERYREAAILNMFFRIGSLSVTLVIAIAFPGMIVYVLSGSILFSLCYLALHFAYIHRALPFFKAGPVREAGLQKRLLSYSVWPWIQTIIVVLTFQADRFWVSGYAGLEEVSAYALVATMFNHIHMIFTAMVAWTLPRIIGRYAINQNTETEYQFIRSLLTVITIVSLLLFYRISPFLFPLWLGEETYSRLEGYIQAFTAFELAFVHTIMPLFYLNGTGRERQATWITMLCCGLCYVLMLSGLWFFHSPVALVEGMTAGACLTAPVFNIVSNAYASGRGQGWRAALEFVPVFAAIGLVYTSSPWLAALLAAAGGWALWKCYLFHLLNRNVWRQVLGAGSQ
jgi:O-antigen/teichoic acid export membrane protein